MFINKANNLFNKLFFIVLQHIKPVLNNSINFIIIILIGRYFSVQELGSYITTFAVYQLLLNISSMGMQGLLVKKIPSSLNPLLLLKTAIQIRFGISILLLITILILGVFSNIFSFNKYNLIFFGLIFSSNDFVDHLNIARLDKKSTNKVILNFLKNILITLLIILLILFLNKNITMIIVAFLFFKFSNFIFYTKFFKIKPLEFNRKFKYISKRLIYLSIPFMINSIGASIVFKIDQIMIHKNLGPEMSGVYGSMIFLILFGVFSINISSLTYLPYILKSKKNLSKEIKNFFILLLSITTSYFLFFLIFGMFVIDFIFNGNIPIQENIINKMIYILPVYLLFIFKVRLNLIYNKNYINAFYVFYLIICNTLLNYYLIPIYKLDGAVYATITSFLSLSLILFFIKLKNKFAEI